MRLTNRFYNEDLLRQTAEEALDNVSKDEARQWYSHPCTKALSNAIQADMCGILNVWLGAGYAEEKSIDATAQRDAKARGMAQALDDVLETIAQISAKELNGEEQIDDLSSRT